MNWIIGKLLSKKMIIGYGFAILIGLASNFFKEDVKAIICSADAPKVDVDKWLPKPLPSPVK